MIIGVNKESSLGVLEQYPVDTSSVFGLSIAEAFSDNPTTKFVQYLDMNRAQGEMITQEAALEKAKSQGVTVHNIPEEGLRSDALDLMIERQYQKKRRQSLIARAEGGFAKGALQFSGELAGSVLDPAGIVASFIPIVGQARYAGLLAKASGPLGRAAVRAGVGAAEGLVGSAILEPASYALSQELGDDYTALNSLLNIGFGTIMGAGLHMGAGAVGDAFQARGERGLVSPQGPIARQMDALSPEARLDVAETAMAQVINDQPIDVAPIVKSRVEAQIGASRERRLSRAREIDPEAFEKLEGIQKELSDLDHEIRGLDNEANAPEPEIIQAANRLAEIEERLSNQRDPTNVLQELGDEEAGILSRFTKEEMAQALDDFNSGRGSIAPAIEELSKRKAYLEEISGGYNKRIADAYKEASSALKRDMDREATSLSDILESETNEIIQARQDALIPEVRQVIERPKDARFIDENVLQFHAEEIRNLPQETRLEEATELANLANQELQEIAKQADIDVKSILKEGSDLVKTSEEFGRAMKALANCALRKG